MGMLDWLFNTEEEHAKYLPEDRGLPEPARVAPMPECKPAKVELPKAAPLPDISEPVIKLLAMLEEDVWELVSTPYNATHLVHVFKEDFRIHVLNLGYRSIGYPARWVLCGYGWMTKDESKKVDSVITGLCESLSRGNLDWKNSCTRSKFKQYLDTV